MIISNVNIGSGPGANDGESIYSAFYKVNQNFANVQSNVNSLTNSVSSVAGRTGNVTLTINDIVGLNTSYAINGNVTAANIGMRGYVDSKIAANVAALIDSAPGALDTLNELAAALNDDASFATTIVNTITLANTIQSNQITSANLGVIGYVDNKVSTANLGMKGYVDSVANQSIYGNSNVASFLPTYSGNIRAAFANIAGEAGTGAGALIVGIPGIESFGNTIAQFHTNVNTDALVSIHNKSTGSGATSGFMATADIGDENNYRTLMGILNSGHATLNWIKPLDSLLLAQGGNLVLGCNSFANISNPVKEISFVLANGTNITPVKIKAESNLASANLELAANVGILFSDGSRQTSAYSNVNTQAYLITNSYATQAFVNDANTALKVYTDGQVTAANAGVTSANIGMLGYVFNANATLRSYTDGQITAANAGVTSANLGMKGYVDSLTYSNVQVEVFTNLSTYAYTANVTSANLGMQGYVDNAVSTANIGMKGYVDNAVVSSGYSNVQVATYLPTYTGNIQVGNVEFASNLGNIRFISGARIHGDANAVNRAGSIVLEPAATGTFQGVVIGGSGRILSPAGSVHLILNVSDFTVQVVQKSIISTPATSATSGAIQIPGGIGAGADSWYGANVTVLGNIRVGIVNTILPNTVASFSSNVNSYTQLTLQNKSTGTDATSDVVLTSNNGTDTTDYVDFGIINSGYDNATPTNSLGNVVYANDAYLYAQGNTAVTTGGNLAIGTTTANKTVKIFAGGNTASSIVMTVANTGVTATTLNITANTPLTGYSNGVLNVEGGTSIKGNLMLSQSLHVNGNIDLDGDRILGGPTTQFTTGGNVSAGNVFVPGTSGKIGFSSGGFVQQATSNATQVTSNTTSGNIQLMGVNLGTNGVLTVAFANNKLTTDDIIVIKHISGGLLSFYVDAYVVSDGLALIWIRNITGSDTSTYYPMLKYAIIRAPSS